ncbi:uncharacterized protein LOC119077953 [Bradysia coprophila]|uniref:uncharacterized protein LOC119077953 n=1 Tax=Bradysia coprophila TaxID=38358 RepID=UPI00187DA756|nr:uncharacterized protein LOC119077953 [Bradysia coprophila]
MFKFALLLVVALVAGVNSHGRLMRPPSRSSVWRVPEFQSLNPPPNWNDNELFCGARHQAVNPGTDCGVCGDPINAATPRPNEMGGQFYRGIITGRYTAGQIIDIDIDMTQYHRGFMEFRLCTTPGNGAGETQACFNQNLLQRADGGGSRTEVTRTGWYHMRYRLPANVRCARCVLQWNYRAGNNWGQCPDGSGALGCGPQETFRGCSDVTIN